jgi:hypothetical protein
MLPVANGLARLRTFPVEVVDGWIVLRDA